MSWVRGPLRLLSVSIRTGCQGRAALVAEATRSFPHCSQPYAFCLSNLVLISSIVEMATASPCGMTRKLASDAIST
jgi:hypothetical protein